MAMSGHASTSQLRDAVESQHGGKAIFVQSVPIYESFKWQAIWNGAVQVFDLVGSPTGATRAYAWSSGQPDGSRRFTVVLHIPPVIGPREAVRAAISGEKMAVK
jgi:hypothetical protein